MNDFRFELGATLKDKITGFEGVVMARNQYLTQCNSYGLLYRKLDKDGKKQDWQWYDEPRLELKKGTKILSLVEKTKTKTGGAHYKDEVAPSN